MATAADALLRRQELLDTEDDTAAAVLKVRILEAGMGNAIISAKHERAQSVPLFETVCVEQKPSMDKQRGMLHPAATHPLEKLPFPTKHRYMLNANAPEWFAKPSHRDIHQFDGSLQQYQCPTAAAADAAPPACISIHGIDNQTRIYFTKS